MKRLNLITVILIMFAAVVLFTGQASVKSDGANLASKHDAPADMDGDGITDWVIVRSSGAAAPAKWYCTMSDGRIEPPMEWGQTGPSIPGGRDYPVIGDFDGDRHDDIAIWRPGKQGRFYVLNSSTMTISVVDLGTTGDEPNIVADYNGDRRDDFAVYRAGVWYYKTDPTSNFVPVAFGEAGDRPVPGDYDGDGKDDQVVVRQSDSNSEAVYYMLLSSGVFTTRVFDLTADEPILENTFVPGDYDGDFRTDLAVVTLLDNAERTFLWRYVSSSTGEVHAARWGMATGAWDWVVPGDYDGDGRYDFAVWRMGTPSRFYVLTSGSGQIIVKEWGQSSLMRDYPLANNWKGPIVIFWGWN